MPVTITSFEQGMAIANLHLQVVQEVEQEFRRGLNPITTLAGGFLRDINQGVQPKDMDFFLSEPSADPEETLRFITRVSEQSGHKFRLLGHNDLTRTEYPRHFQVWESFEYPEGDFPYNLIFVPFGEYHPLAFDIAMCNIYLYAPGQPLMPGQGYVDDIENNTLTILNIRDQFLAQEVPEAVEVSLATLAVRLRKHLDKYPTRKVVLGRQFLTGNPVAQRTYEYLRELNLIEEPRALLPAERQDLDRYELRLQDGEIAARGAQVARARELLAVMGAEWGRVEARVGALRDPAQVPPRPEALEPFILFDDPH